MLFMDRVAAAQVHRATYVAILNSALHSSGAKQALAHNLAITPQYLSNLLNPGYETMAYTRTPGPRLAARIAQLLPLQTQARSSLLEHMHLAWEYERECPKAVAENGRLTHRAPLMSHVAGELLAQIREAHAELGELTDAARLKQRFRVLMAACELLLGRLSLWPGGVGNRLGSTRCWGYALDYAELCLIEADVQCVLNRPSEAWAHVMSAREVLQAYEPGDYKDEEDRFRHLTIASMVSQCVTYRNLRLYKRAYETTLEAEMMAREMGSCGADAWLPQIYLNRLRALSYRPRFSQSEASQLARTATAEADRLQVKQNPGWAVQLMEAEGRAYAQYGTSRSVERAANILDGVVHDIGQMTRLGLIQRTQLLRTYAYVQWKRKAFGEWYLYLMSALHTALHAGLEDQFNYVMEEYGPSATSAVEEVKPILLHFEQRHSCDFNEA